MMREGKSGSWNRAKERVAVKDRGGVDSLEKVGVVLLGRRPVVQGLREGRGSGVVLEERARTIHE